MGAELLHIKQDFCVTGTLGIKKEYMCIRIINILKL